MLKIVDNLLKTSQFSEFNYLSIKKQHIGKDEFDSIISNLKSKKIFDNFELVENKIYRNKNFYLLATDSTKQYYYLNNNFNQRLNGVNINIFNKVYNDKNIQTKNYEEIYKQKILKVTYKNINVLFKIKGETDKNLDKNIYYDIEIKINQQVNINDVKKLIDNLF